MNSGVDIISLSSPNFFIGVVKYIARTEGEAVLDKLGNTLRPFEIIFNSGDILTGARAAPMGVYSEVNIGDSIIIYSMESIYNNTFLYQPIRNISSPKDTIKLKYNNAIIEFKPGSKESADLLLSAGNNLIAVNSDDGTVTVDTLDGVRINGGAGTLDMRNDVEDLHTLVDNLISTIMNMKIVLPSGQGMVHPLDMNKLLELGNRFDDLLGEVNPTDNYPVVPDDTYTLDYVQDVVRETGLDILTDDGEYVPGNDPTIDNLRPQLPNEYATPVSVEGVESSSEVGTAQPVDVDCPVGEIRNGLRLSPNYTIADLSVRAHFPHTLRDQVGLSKNQIACNLKALATNILEPLRAQYPNIFITSAFRASTGTGSQHNKGEAVDIQIRGLAPSGYMAIADWIKMNLPFDQLIFEHGKSIWLHISHKKSGTNRKQLLTMFRGKYTPGLRLHY